MCLLALAVAGMLAGPVAFLTPAAGAAPFVPPTTTPTKTPTTAPPTNTPTNTATATPATPPTIALVSPQSGAGPVGAYITISGNNFSGTSATIFAAAHADCGASQGTLTTVSVSGGAISKAFLWPTSLNNGTYYICASGITSGAPSYQVLAATPPTLSLSAPSIPLGQTLTINGSSFVGLPSGGQVILSEVDGRGHTVTILQVAVGTDGAFSTPWTVAGNTGNMTISAASQQEIGAQRPVLQAAAQVVVQAAGTATVTVTAAPTATVVGGASPSTQQPGDNTGLVLLVIGLILLLAVLLGIAAFLMLRQRNGPDGDDPSGTGGYAPGEYPGYAARNRETAKVPQIGMTGRQSAAGQYGRSGFYDPSGGFAGGQAGGVSRWEEQEPLPGPDWQPRPMSGHPQDYEPTGLQSSGFDPNAGWGGYDDGPTNRGGGMPRANDYPSLEYPPVDPWGNAGGGTQPSAGGDPWQGQRPNRTPRPQRNPGAPNWGGETNPTNGG